jgi:lysozyme family protein
VKFTDVAKRGYGNLWARAVVQPWAVAALNGICNKLISNRSRYAAIEKEIGVPWWFVAMVHERESSCDFTTYLGNGDPLSEVTHDVPRGRGPFHSWEAGAIDALKLQGLDKVKDWSIPAALYQFEAYNGWGYDERGINSPYVWSFTNLYTSGKYKEDDVFYASVVDPQPGCAAMLKIMLTLIPDLIPVITQEAPPMTTPVSIPTAPTPANSTAGLNLSTGQIISSFVTAITGSLFGVGGPIAILAQGTSWAHWLGAGAALLAGVASVTAPILSLINANLGAIDNTIGAVAGTIANSVNAPAPAPAPAA